MKVILVEDEIARLRKLKKDASSDAKTFYSRLILYLSGAGDEISNDLYSRIENEINRRGDKNNG